MSSRSIERTARDVPDDLGALAHRPGRAHGHAAHMGFEVEVGVLDPHRMPEVERDVHEPAAERLEEMHPILEHLQHPLEGETLARAGVEDHRADDVRELGRRLHVEEGRVHPAERLHAGTPLWRSNLILARPVSFLLTAPALPRRLCC
jgi:hypothetical protein